MLCISLGKDLDSIPAELAQKLDCSKNNYTYLLHLGLELIGWGQIIVHNENEQELANIQILDKYQRQGYGTKLLKFIIYNSPFQKLMLSTITPGFYLKLGFRPTEAIPSFINYQHPDCQQCQPEKCRVLYFEKPFELTKYESDYEKQTEYLNLLKEANSMLCEFSKVNNKIWNFTENPYFLKIADQLFLILYPFDNDPYACLLPYQKIPKTTIDKFFDFLTKQNINIIKPLTALSGRHIKNNSKVKLIENRSNFDYLYKVSDFASFAGRHFEKKRNRLKKFIKNYPNYKIVDYLSEHYRELLAFAEKITREIRDIPACASYEVIKKCMRETAVSGFFVTINEKIVGLLFYSELNPLTVVVHFEFIDPEYDGVAQLLNNELGKRLLGKYKYINREQDLGLEGLRQSKLSYRPYRLLKKYDAYLL
jgi:N-acetylglutamate synthase-like GNAT family acetyltransferase